MRIADLITVLREDGPRWLTWRLWYEVQLRWGFSRTLSPVSDVGLPLARALNMPVEKLDDWLYQTWREEAGAFFPVGAAVQEVAPFVADKAAVVALAERTLAGEFHFFSSDWRQLGFPPDWFRGMREGTRWRSDLHWSQLPDLSPELGDIKYVWEPSRFGFVYTLARAWAVTGDQRYPEAFWALVESWLDLNHPEQGPHWRCAQEMALRSMAWAFGLSAFKDCPGSTPARVARLLKNLWYHAYHIEKVHWYAAECVRNNHAISEATGLFTIGTLFPFLPAAARWQRKGAAALARELSWQVYGDGAYVQHSMNYARFVVQLCTWVLRLAEVNRVAPPAAVHEAAGRLLHFMLALQDGTSGRVPNYGSNDGALILPLSSCDYLDYRPALGALSLALGLGRRYEPGPWDEEAAWLCGPDSLNTEPKPSVQVSTGFAEGGYYTLRGPQTYGLIRCAVYRHRPAQADMLHLDVWYHGHNVLIDPGTYSYNAKPPWSGHFVGTAAHNTVTVDGRDQMRKGSRFMWLNWTKSLLLSFVATDGRVRFSGEHYSYTPLVHRRTVELDNDTYIILDELTGGQGDHDYRLHWLVGDYSAELQPDGAMIRIPGHERTPLRLAVVLTVGESVDIARAQVGDRPRGWQSLCYGTKSSALSLELTRRGVETTFITILGPEARVNDLLALGHESLAAMVRHPRGTTKPGG